MQQVTGYHMNQPPQLKFISGINSCEGASIAPENSPCAASLSSDKLCVYNGTLSAPRLQSHRGVPTVPGRRFSR